MTSKKQCNFCAFHLIEVQSTPEKAKYIEEKYSAIRSIKNAPKKPRIIKASTGNTNTDKTETCAINSNYWLNKKKAKEYCTDYIDNILPLSDTLSLHTAKSTDKLTRNIHHMTIVILVITCMALVIAFTAM